VITCKQTSICGQRRSVYGRRIRKIICASVAAVSLLLADSSPLPADRIETSDQIEYRTEPGNMKTPYELQREEKEKEERSWQMLDNMVIVPDGRRHRRPLEETTPRQ